MLLILQIVLFAWFIVLLIQAIFDFLHGSLLILSGLILLAVAYTLKFVALLIRLCARISLFRRYQIAKRFRFVRF
jgi:hypothetical protein